ncbi:hypothetical protein ACLMNJ_32690 [Streptomyces seoulensis]
MIVHENTARVRATLEWIETAAVLSPSRRESAAPVAHHASE